MSKTSPNDLRDSLVGISEWLGYGHGERAPAWLARLEINGPEIDAFKAHPRAACEPYRPVATTVSPADGTKAGSGNLRADAADAIARARSRPELHAFTWIAEKASPHAAGYLAGVPVVVKDLMGIAGVPMTGGSAASDRTPSKTDAEAVARLKRHGAVVIAAANLHEWAYGITSDNPAFGRVVNPVAPDRIPGGSSGGSAAAVAAGIVQAAVGSDTAGSIRVPAACCGIVGFKPSYDAVPRTGAVDLAASLDHIGPMGASVPACAALFAAMLDLPAVPRWQYETLSGRRIARLGGFFDAPLDGEVRAALDAAEAALAKDGASCGPANVAGMELAAAIQFMTICPEASEVHAERLAARGPQLGEDVRVRLEIGNFLPGHWYVKAQRMRRELVERIDSLLRDADFLICATMRAPAQRVGASRVEIGGKDYALHTAVTQLTMPFNLSGLPAITIPWSRNADGVPIGLQLVGRRGADWQVLGAAERLESFAP
jgi:Asp-tRNA(Asn)/Glu-tRNA(Gln) amidotransferase A subunit family amidase